MIESTEYPYLRIRVRSGPFNADASALVDTGFDGYLALPRALSVDLGVPQFAEPIGVASGDVFMAPGYLGTVQLVGFQDDIPGTIVLVGDEYTLGRGILDRYVVTLHRGRRLTVEQ